MSRSDLILLVIVLTILVLVGLAFAAILVRPAAAYRPERQPEDAVYNYLLALRTKDYARAYTCLSPQLEGYPASLEQFERSIGYYDWQFAEGSALSIQSASTSAAQSTVMVLEKPVETSLLDASGSARRLEFHLRLENGVWKLISGEAYFAMCWTSANACP